MVGMLQIITYLLCVYLVFKGFEILQIGLASAREDRAAPLLIGVIFVLVSLVAAYSFWKMVDAQASSVSNRMQSQP